MCDVWSDDPALRALVKLAIVDSPAWTALQGVIHPHVTRVVRGVVKKSPLASSSNLDLHLDNAIASVVDVLNRDDRRGLRTWDEWGNRNPTPEIRSWLLKTADRTARKYRDRHCGECRCAVLTMPERTRPRALRIALEPANELWTFGVGALVRGSPRVRLPALRFHPDAPEVAVTLPAHATAVDLQYYPREVELVLVARDDADNTIVRAHLNRALSRRQLSALETFDDAAVMGAAPDSETRVLVRDLMDYAGTHLAEDQFRALRCHLDGYDHAEIAQALGLPSKREADKLVRQALARLRHYFRTTGAIRT